MKGCTSEMTTRPPGRTTRASSPMGGLSSMQCVSARAQTAMSKEPGASGSATRSPRSKCPVGTFPRASFEHLGGRVDSRDSVPTRCQVERPPAGSTGGIKGRPRRAGVEHLLNHPLLGHDDGVVGPVVAAGPFAVALPNTGFPLHQRVRPGWLLSILDHLEDASCALPDCLRSRGPTTRTIASPSNPRMKSPNVGSSVMLPLLLLAVG